MTLKQRIRKKQLTVGSWITIPSPAIAEIMAKSGFDWLAIDMEHAPISIDQCQELIRIIDLCSVVPLVRVGENAPLLIKQAMDAGASGVIVPMVNSRHDAERAVSAVKYPPQGTRGVGLSRAQGYGTTFHDYKKWLEKESIVIIQIEHIKAVENLQEILTVEGVDGFIIGPYDLSGSLGVPGDFTNKKMKPVFKKINSILGKKNISAGFHVVPFSVELVQEKINEGYNFIAFSVDFLFLGESCRHGLDLIRKRNRIK